MSLCQGNHRNLKRTSWLILSSLDAIKKAKSTKHKRCKDFGTFLPKTHTPVQAVLCQQGRGKVQGTEVMLHKLQTSEQMKSISNLPRNVKGQNGRKASFLIYSFVVVVVVSSRVCSPFLKALNFINLSSTVNWTYKPPAAAPSFSQALWTLLTVQLLHHLTEL